MILYTREELLDTHPEMYFSTGQAACVLEVGTTTVKRLESAGKLHALKNGNGWRYFNAGEVFALLEERNPKEHSDAET